MFSSEHGHFYPSEPEKEISVPLHPLSFQEQVLLSLEHLQNIHHPLKHE